VRDGDVFTKPVGCNVGVSLADSRTGSGYIRNPGFGLNADLAVHGIPQPLFVTEIPLGELGADAP
jgi:hypothetical protein